MLGICFFTLGQNTLKAPHLEGEKGKRGLRGKRGFGTPKIEGPRLNFEA